MDNFNFNPYPPESQREDLMKQAEQGRKYKAAKDVLDEMITTQRAHIINQLETAEFSADSDAISLIIYLRTLRLIEDYMKTEIDKGELAEEELVRLDNE